MSTEQLIMVRKLAIRARLLRNVTTHSTSRFSRRRQGTVSTVPRFTKLNAVLHDLHRVVGWEACHLVYVGKWLATCESNEVARPAVLFFRLSDNASNTRTYIRHKLISKHMRKFLH